MDVAKGLGQALRDKREGLHWSRWDLALRSGVNINSIGPYEAGKCKMPVDALIKFCRAFECTPNDLTLDLMEPEADAS